MIYPTNLLNLMFDTQRTYLELWSKVLTPLIDVAQANAEAARGSAREIVPFEGGREQTIGVGEESFDVSTRRIPGEAVRVRRVVKEIPVERKVQLHDETFIIERRAPNGKRADDDSLIEREYVMVETREVPVVHKKMRLREEVVVRRRMNQHVEVVRDVIRRADVQIEQPHQKMPVVQPQQQQAGE